MSFSAQRVAAVLVKPWLFSIVSVFALLAPHWAAADDLHALHRPFDRIVVFGTSLSDPGNAFALTGENISPPGYGMTGLALLTLIPDFPYAKGGNHFSNGPTWIEQLAKPIGLEWSVRPAMRESIRGSSNYAVGGTRARNGVDGEVWLSQQVTAFLRDAGPHVPSNALFVIEMGGNDIRDALALGDPAIIGAALTSIAQNIQILYGAGARKFLVWNAPNLALTPAIRTLGILDPRIPVFAEQLTLGFNANLSAILGMLSGLPGIEIVRFDAFGALNMIVARPAAFGLRDVTTACITPNVPPFQCQHPNRQLFWDGIHPTRAAHGIIALLVARTLFVEMLQDD
jgi:phospholipase/lecithinase/hemolysin